MACNDECRAVMAKLKYNHELMIFNQKIVKAPCDDLKTMPGANIIESTGEGICTAVKPGEEVSSLEVEKYARIYSPYDEYQLKKESLFIFDGNRLPRHMDCVPFHRWEAWFEPRQMNFGRDDWFSSTLDYILELKLQAYQCDKGVTILYL